MTWGELGAHLVAVFPALDPSLRVQYLNRAQEAILDERQWSGLQKTFTLRTEALADAGTVALTEGSATVTGAGTAFSAGMAGYRFRPLDAEGDAYLIAAYVSPTEVTLDRTYDGETASGLAYHAYRDVFDLPLAAKSIQSLTPEGGLPLEQLSLGKIDELHAAAHYYGEPRAYAALSDPLSIASPVLNQVRIWPAPLDIYDLAGVYQSAVYGFDGRNTAAGPLPWISRPALLAKAKQLAALDSSDRAIAVKTDAYKAEYISEVRKMHSVENARVGPSRLEGPTHFFPHRREWGMR